MSPTLMLLLQQLHCALLCRRKPHGRRPGGGPLTRATAWCAAALGAVHR